MKYITLFKHKPKFIGVVLLSILLIQIFIGSSLATTARYAQNYDDTVINVRRTVNDDTYGDMQNLRVNYSMGEGICLIRGVNYTYRSVAIGANNVDIQFEADSTSANYSDTGIPYTVSDIWRTFYATGLTYLLDDDPAINFIGTQSSISCIEIAGTTPSAGHSYRDQGSGWILDSFEYLVRLIYELIPALNISEAASGQITTSDNVDAYFANLTAGVPYMFILDRTSGTGNLNLRLVNNQELTNNVLASSSGTSDPEYLAYTPSSNGTYVLLVEAEDAGVDVANYDVSFMIDNPPTSNHPSPVVTTSTGPETIDWVLYDDFGPGSYRVLVNSSPSLWNTWSNNTNLQFPINRSAPGDFNYTIQFNDSGNNWGAPDTVLVTILDSAPTANHPDDIITPVNSSAVIPWILTDDYGSGYYRVFINVTPSAWQPWQNNSAINYPINTTVGGSFEYVILYNDSAGNSGIPDLVIVTVEPDTTPPTSNIPSNITTTRYGTETIDWILQDNVASGHYRILINDNPSNWSAWLNNTNLQYPINRSVPGVFNYTIEYNDSAGLWGIPDTLFVTILDNPPISNQPSNILTSTTSSAFIPWNITDDYGSGFYRVLINTSPRVWQTWTNNSILNYPVNTTLPGVFNYTIQFNDSAGQLGPPDTVIVTVLLDAPPTSNHPLNITTYVGYSETIDWILTDDAGAGFYRVLIDGTPGPWNPWINNTSIDFPINTTAPGFFTYMIDYNDSAGQLGASDTVYVTIDIDDPPQSTHPLNITTHLGYLETIEWIITDDVGTGFYRVFINDTPGTWTTWTNNTSVDYPINTTITGTFNYTIQYNDSAGYWGIPDTVFISISVDNPPTTTHPSDITTITDYVVFIDWILTDDVGAGNYRVLINGSPSQWVTWTNGASIHYPINTSNVGVYSYIIEFNDSAGQWGTPDTVLVTINEPPPFPTGETEVNLTCILQGTNSSNQDGFSIPVDGWNTTYTEMLTSNVSLFDYFYVLEDDFDLAIGFRNQIDTEVWVMGFNVTDSCTIDSVDFVYSTPFLGDTPYTEVFIYNASYSALKGKPEPDQIIYNQNESGLAYLIWPFMGWVSTNTGSNWNGTFTIKPVLDPANTYGNMFFIGFNTSSTLYWHYINDEDDLEGDQGLVYRRGFEGAWYNISTPTDLTLRMQLKPFQSQKTPSDLNMLINSIPVTSSGTWNDPTFIIPEPSGSLLFNVTSSWYNISFQINWTVHLSKITNAITSYYAVPTNPIVMWNITIPILFAAGSSNKTINVTIPVTWNTTKVYYNFVEYSTDSWDEIVGSKHVLITDADDGTWIVMCEGSNWIYNITLSKTEIYTFDIVDISAWLILPVFETGNDTAQLFVTDPFSQILDDTLTGKGNGTFINLTWNVAQSIHTHGEYQLIISWFNGTEAGIYNMSIQVYNSTSITIVSPEHRGTIIEMTKGQIFNLTIYYNMSYWIGSSWGTLYLNRTMGANVTYSFQGSASTPMTNISFGGNWAWTVEITSPNIHGTYPIFINATAWGNIQNYTNYVITLQVKQYGTNLIFNDTAKEVVWGTPIAFSYTYTNLTGHSIVTSNLTIDWKFENDITYRGLLQEGLNFSVSYSAGTEDYTIIFANFSAHTYNLLFNIEADIYQSQQAYLTLIFNNRTTSLINQTTISRIVYQNLGFINFIVYYEDTYDSIGISGGALQSNWSNIKDYSVQDIGNGYYNFTFNISSVALNLYSILITASKNNYETANLMMEIEIYGYASNISSLYAQNLTGNFAIIYAMENWTVIFEYINASNSAGLAGATISATFGGEICYWENGVSGNYTVWADASKLATPMSGSNYTLSVLIEKSSYEIQLIVITVYITELPTQLYPEQLIMNAEIDDFVVLRVQLNDTYNNHGIVGTIWYDLQGQTQQMLPTGTFGQYYTILNLTGYISGVYQINISSWAADYQNTTINVTLIVSLVDVIIIPSSDPFSGYVTQWLNTTIQVKDTNNQIVEALTIAYGIDFTSVAGTFTYEGNGIYSANINTTALSAQIYTLRITTFQTTKYSPNVTDYTLIIDRIPSLIIPATTNITGYYGNLYILMVNYLDTLHSLPISGENLQYEISSIIPLTGLIAVGAGSYQAPLNLTEIGIGSYIIRIQTSGGSAIYQDTNTSIILNILPKIQTKLIIAFPTVIRMGEILNATMTLLTITSSPLANQMISYTLTTELYNGSDVVIQNSLMTTGSGIVNISYLIPFGARYISMLGYFAGSSNYTTVLNSTLKSVKGINYTLTIHVQASVNVGENLIIRAQLSNETHPIANALINFTIIVLNSNEISVDYNLGGYTLSNGTVSVTFRVPDDALSIYIIAYYKDVWQEIVATDPSIVIAVDPLSALWQRLAAPIAIIALLVIFAIAGFYVIRSARSRFMSLESKKRNLLQKRAETRKEINVITQEIQQLRAETLKEADVANKAMDFAKAAKFYEKAGNLTLELADKSVAREFFIKSKEMQKLVDQKKKQRDMVDQREKLLEKARSAIRDRNIVEASRNYRQVAEISRILGEREQANKFLKLADAAHERIEALKEGDLRKKSGVFLSKADKAMGKQNFLDAAENFEEAAKIMLALGDDEGVQRFTGWAKLARERDALSSAKTKDEWENELIEQQKELIQKAKGFVRVKNFEEAREIYLQLTIYALELGNLASVKKFKRDIDFCRNQAALKGISPEVQSLLDERKKLLSNAEEAISNNRYAAAARYYNRIATISESIEGKEVARTYQRQAKYYLDKAQEKRITQQPKLAEAKISGDRELPVAKVAVDELEETKAKLATTVKNARDALKTGKSVLARELYEKSSNLAASIGDKEAELRYKQKAEEIGIMKPQKKFTNEGEVRKNIAELMQKAEKSLQKKKYEDAKNCYEEISELFIQLGEEDAANEFLERANSMRRIIKK